MIGRYVIFVLLVICEDNQLFELDNLLLPNVMGFKFKTFGYKFIVGTFTLTEYRCTVIKVPHPKREEGLVLLLQNYPHPSSLRGRDPYHFPTPLNS